MKFFRYGGEEPGKPVELKEEYTEFILADKVVVNSHVDGNNWQQEMSKWESGSYYQILSVTYFDNGEMGSVQYQNGRLITVERDGKASWYLVSHAWLMGPEGKTIERIA